MAKIKKIDSVIIMFILLFCLPISIYFLVKTDYMGLIKSLFIIPIIFIPSIIRKLFKRKFKYVLETIFLIFIFLGWYIGYALGIYDIFKPYDKFIHTIFGIVTCFIAIYIMNLFKVYKNINIWFNIIFFISISFAFESIWEIEEYIVDNIFKTNNQGVIETGIGDTMWDLIVTLIGSIIFCISYYYEIIFKKELIIKKYIKLLN